jgi:hypothetical protein
VIDHTETIVLPEDELAKRRPARHCNARDDVAEIAFDDTLVLEDELEKYRRRRSLRDFAG